MNPTEFDIAKAIRDGRLSSPQRLGNLLLIALRITGTGLAYRSADREYVWRDPSLYLNDEFLDRCAGLPVLWEHPRGRILDSREFSNRIIGTVALPYILGQEIWAVAKIYDAAAAEMLCRETLSTSPTVVFTGVGQGTRRPMGDGSMLLIEGRPTSLDHVAVTPLGVWDKGGPASGVARGKTDQILHQLEARG